MEMETKTIELDVDDELQGKLEVLQQEGWGLVPGVKPRTTYNICRLKPSSGDGAMGIGRLLIDDAGVMVLPADAHKKN